jgi:hypothetical protein
MTTENFDAPQLTPVFSFTTEEGDKINIYVAKTVHTTVSFITLVSDELFEHTWAIVTNDFPAAFRELVEKARDTYNRTVRVSSNPFDELLVNEEMMRRLETVSNKVSESRVM